MKILVVCFYYQNIEPECEAGLKQLEKSKLHEYVILRAKSSSLVQARNKVIAAYLPQKFDKIITIDSDIEFSESTIEAGIAHGKEFVAFPYERKGEDLYECGVFGSEVGHIVERFPLTTKGLQEVRGYVGAGLNIYDAQVLLNMIDEELYPWYYMPVVKDDTDMYGLTVTGEDIGFCINLMKADVPIYVDFDMPVRHILRVDEETGIDSKTLRLEPVEIGLILKSIDELPRKLANPIYEKICKQVGKTDD
jgi:hypothetical protein